METLLALQFITLERLNSGVSTSHITLQGYALLKLVGVLRACKGVLATVA